MIAALGAHIGDYAADLKLQLSKIRPASGRGGTGKLRTSKYTWIGI